MCHSLPFPDFEGLGLVEMLQKKKECKIGAVADTGRGKLVFGTTKPEDNPIRNKT